MADLRCPLPFAQWNESVRQWIDSRPHRCWAIAVSGGADSVFLLLSVVRAAQERSVAPVCLHFNHRLRGAESDRDQAVVERLCGSLGIRFVTGAWAEAPSAGAASESEARAARLAFLKAEMKRLGTSVLFTGHQAEDVAETLLLRLARGSGAAGLAAPRPVQHHGPDVVFLRPLLDCRRIGIRHALERAGIAWAEDSTNGQRLAPRNRLRHDVLAAWAEAADRDGIAGALRTRKLLDEDDQALLAWAERVLAEAGGLTTSSFPVAAFASLPRAILRRSLATWEPCRTLSAQGFETLLALCAAGKGRVSIGDRWAEIQEGKLSLRTMLPSFAAIAEQPLEVGQTVAWTHGQNVIFHVLAVGKVRNEEIRRGEVDPDSEAWIASPGKLVVRSWRAGDRYAPLGLNGSCKVQDLWVNRKVPMEKRPLIPLIVAEDGQIVWIPGFPPADAYRVIPDCRVLGHLTYHPGTSSFLSQSLST